MRVAFVDDCKPLRLLVSLLLESEAGIPCLMLESLDDVVTHANDVLTSTVVMIDINLGAGQPDGVVVYDWLRSQSYAGQVFFLTGHAKDSPQVQEASRTGVAVLEKPMLADEIVQLLRRAIRGPDPDPRPEVKL